MYENTISQYENIYQEKHFQILFLSWHALLEEAWLWSGHKLFEHPSYLRALHQWEMLIISGASFTAFKKTHHDTL